MTKININRDTDFTLIQLQNAHDIPHRLKYKTVNILCNIMPYVEDENGDHILDENGDKIEFTVDHFNDPNTYVYNKEEILVNDGHLDTEDRHLVIKYTKKRQPCDFKGSTESSYQCP